MSGPARLCSERGASSGPRYEQNEDPKDSLVLLAGVGAFTAIERLA